MGAFSPTAFPSDGCEVAVKRYRAGDAETAHYHKVATEITCVIMGEVKFNDTIYRENDIIVVEPNDIVAFSSLTDSVTVVVKVPFAKGDKYVIDSPPG